MRFSLPAILDRRQSRWVSRWNPPMGLPRTTAPRNGAPLSGRTENTSKPQCQFSTPYLRHLNPPSPLVPFPRVHFHPSLPRLPALLRRNSPEKKAPGNFLSAFRILALVCGGAGPDAGSRRSIWWGTCLLQSSGVFSGCFVRCAGACFGSKRWGWVGERPLSLLDPIPVGWKLANRGRLRLDLWGLGFRFSILLVWIWGLDPGGPVVPNSFRSVRDLALFVQCGRCFIWYDRWKIWSYGTRIYPFVLPFVVIFRLSDLCSWAECVDLRAQRQKLQAFWIWLN